MCIDHIALTRWKITLEIGKQYGKTGDYNSKFFDYVLALYKQPGQLKCLANLTMNFHSFAALDHFSKPEGFPPVFVIWGEENKILPLKTGEAFCQQSSPDRIEVITVCRHLVIREKPEAVNQMMKTFLDNVTN